MNIYLSGYLDRNLGDDLMLKIIAYRFREHNFYVSVKKRSCLYLLKMNLICIC